MQKRSTRAESGKFCWGGMAVDAQETPPPPGQSLEREREEGDVERERNIQLHVHVKVLYNTSSTPTNIHVHVVYAPYTVGIYNVLLYVYILANEREDQLNHELDMCRAQEHSELSGQPWNQAMGTGWIVLEE